MRKFNVVIALFSVAILLAACSNTPKLVSEPMPRSGFLPNYSVLVPMATSQSDVRIWRYRVSGVNPSSYTAVILDPIYLNQSATKEVSAEAISQAQITLQDSMIDAVNSRGNIRIVTSPGPGVARITVGITGAESMADSLQPWNFTPIGLAANAAAYAGGVNSKTPALLVESKITDSQSKQLLGEGLVTIQGESFRTGSGSVSSFIEMAKKVVRVAMETSANPTPTGQ
ncbi:hypothetical protein A9236_05230 [Polynucleobacter sp. QLW-P1DATA-2]|uniref:DUF3313 family protein n=1 Tax=unclassified Polynucleobacter TaxID=2640945 RepID=UPI0008F82001|nr:MULTISPECIES: DUF3313 family protein [unclassified Polynucleobacter]OIM98792.1 hypothetical protein A9235_08035 [Polynucleobacter sp. MWH-Tro8-2-5-gr]OIN00625.1 hypothetical protein A9236_05230 [Polynucleobacter sp. QLW-P1DATA-2]